MSRSPAVSFSSLRRRFRTRLLMISAICFCCGLSDGTGAAQSNEELRPGVTQRRELAGGRKDAWRLELAAGAYVQFVIEPKDIEIVASLTDPDGKHLLKNLSPNLSLSERLLIVNSLIAEGTGTYTLEISPQRAEAEPGEYEVKIEDLRPAQESDRIRTRAHGLWTEGMGLRAQGSTTSRRNAVLKYEEALSLLQRIGDRKGEASTLHTIGDVWYDLTNAQKAFESYDSALKIVESLGRQIEAGIGLSQLGLISYVKYDYAKASEFYDRALEKHRAAGDRFFEAVTLNRIGWSYNAQGEKRRALESYFQALSIRREIKNREGESISLNDIGRGYADLGDVQEALEAYRQALKLRPPERNPLGAANILNRIGILQSNTSEWQKALDTLNQALALVRQANNKRTESSILNNIGYIFAELGDAPRAIDCFEKALALARETQLRGGEATILQQMGRTFASAGEFWKGIESLSQALEIQRAINDPTGEALSLGILARFYISVGDYPKALGAGGLALEKFRAQGGNAAESAVLRNIAYSHAMLGRTREALEYYDQALSRSRSTQNRGEEALTLIQLGALKGKMGNLAEARGLFESGIKLYESVRGRLVGQDLRASYLASVQSRYEQYIDLLMELERKEPQAGHAAAALEMSERTRARSLLELLTETNADIRQGVDPALLANERALQQRLNAKAAIQSNLLARKHKEAQAVALAKEISDLTNQLDDAAARIRASSPRYAALTQPEPLSLKEIKAQLDENTVLLEFALGTNHSWIWIVTTGEISSFRLPARNEIETAARKVYGSLTARQPNDQESSIQYAARVAEADAKFQTEAAALSRMLLSPIADRLGLEWKSKRLVIVASGALDYLPFAILPAPSTGAKTDEAGRPLIADHEIVNLPSASVLAAIRRESSGRRQAGKTLAILADPVFEANDPRVLIAARKRAPSDKLVSSVEPIHKSSNAPAANAELMRSVRSFRRSGFSQLPYSRVEAEAISALIPRAELFKAMGFMVNRATATSGELAHYRIIHFATHGLLNSEHPELSGLVLSLVDENGKPQDGFLRMHEIYNLHLPADLVVLSACQTAVGKEARGEGLVGLTRGFMYAGAERVVASLWQVDDLATSELMKRFYRAMLTGKMRPAAALRTAQIEMMKQKRWSNPYFWAGFTMQGEWR